MSVVYLGSKSIGEAVPGASAAAAAGAAGIGLALPDLLSRIAALQAFAPTPVSFPDMLALAQQTLQSIQLGISLGLPVPDISAQILAVEALVASLLAAVSAVNDQLSLVTGFQGLLATAGVYLYASDGTVGNLGSELASALGSTPGMSGASHANAVILVTTTPSVWTAMGNVFQVTP